MLETVLAEIQEGAELDFKTFLNNLIFFSKMQFCFTDWIFI